MQSKGHDLKRERKGDRSTLLYYLKKTWKESLLTVLCQITAYGVEVFAALTSMVMLDGLLEQAPRKFIWGLLTHLMIWAVSFLASHLETVFHYQAMRRINALERKDMTAALMKKNHQQFHTQESGAYLSSFTNDVAQMEQLGWEPFSDCLASRPKFSAAWWRCTACTGP